MIDRAFGIAQKVFAAFQAFPIRNPLKAHQEDLRRLSVLVALVDIQDRDGYSSELEDTSAEIVNTLRANYPDIEIAIKRDFEVLEVHAVDDPQGDEVQAVGPDQDAGDDVGGHVGQPQALRQARRDESGEQHERYGHDDGGG